MSWQHIDIDSMKNNMYINKLHRLSIKINKSLQFQFRNTKSKDKLISTCPDTLNISWFRLWLCATQLVVIFLTYKPRYHDYMDMDFMTSMANMVLIQRNHIAGHINLVIIRKARICWLLYPNKIDGVWQCWINFLSTDSYLILNQRWI